MVPSISCLVAALCYCGLAVAQKYTYQTAPASGDFLEADKPLVVRWEMRPGNSPDSPNVATPPTLTVSLGFRKGETAVVLYPPIGQVTGDISAGSWTWQKMDFSSFINGPPPPRDTTTEWFIRLGDQNTGYVSNGQLFKILEVTPGNTATSTTNPAAPTAPTAPGTVPPTTSNTPASTAAPAAPSSAATPAAPPTKTRPTAAGPGVSPTSTPQPQNAASALGATCVALLVPAALIVSLV